MATPVAPFIPKAESAERIVTYAKKANNSANADWNIRSQMEMVDLAYMREDNLGTEHRRAKMANSYGDKKRFQDVTVPIVMPQVESGVAYLASTFLSGYPIFSAVSNPRNMDAAQQFDTLMGEHSIRGGWVRELTMFFRDNLKYNLAALEVSWQEKKVFSPMTDASSLSKIKLNETIWRGNTLRRLDMYNVFFDSRVAPSEVHSKGEFAGYVQLMSRVALKQFVMDMEPKIHYNLKKAFESGARGAQQFYIPQLNAKATMHQATSGSFDWMSWAGVEAEKGIKYKNMYEVTTLYARIIPKDFDMAVPARGEPQIWKFVLVNNEVLLYAERQTNAHNFLPILISQVNEDGLNFQTKSFAENAMPYQDVSSTLMNSAIHSRRRAVYDRLIYDPSRINVADINSSNPVARIPVRPAAYGKNVADAVHYMPYHDDQTAGVFQQLGMLSGFANTMQGLNPAQQGQFVKGNKTQHEYADVMQHSNARLQTMALFLEAQTFVPLKEILKLNILQYASDEVLYNRDTKQSVKISPEELRTAALEFQISDGLLPTDKLINAETFQVALQILGSSPQMQAEFDVVGFMIYYLKTQGAKNLEEFRRKPQQAAIDSATGQPIQPQQQGQQIQGGQQ